VFTYPRIRFQNNHGLRIGGLDQIGCSDNTGPSMWLLSDSIGIPLNKFVMSIYFISSFQTIVVPGEKTSVPRADL
jgi:hypothetical protein